MPGHKPRSDYRHITLLNTPHYLPNIKHEQVHFMGYLRQKLHIMFHDIIINNLKLLPHPHANVLLILIRKTLSCKILPSSSSNTRKGVCRRSDLNQNQLQAMPAASWSSTSDSMVLFRFSYRVQFKNQLLIFFLVSKDQIYFPLRQHANLFPSNFSQWIQTILVLLPRESPP